MNQVPPFEARIDWPHEIEGTVMEDYVAWIGAPPSADRNGLIGTVFHQAVIRERIYSEGPAKDRAFNLRGDF